MLSKLINYCKITTGCFMFALFTCGQCRPSFRNKPNEKLSSALHRFIGNLANWCMTIIMMMSCVGFCQDGREFRRPNNARGVHERLPR
jgi:hypothetical protein